MLKVSVEAFADETRPRGGYAVILLRGVTSMPPQPTIRLKPVDGGGTGARQRIWRGEQIIPVATRLTEDGIQIVVGPEVVGNPNLLSGTPVMIEIPDADVRGEFVWPDVVPLTLPKRRHMAAARRVRPSPPPRDGQSTLARPEPAGEILHAAGLNGSAHAHAEATPRLVPSMIGSAAEPESAQAIIAQAVIAQAYGAQTASATPVAPPSAPTTLPASEPEKKAATASATVEGNSATPPQPAVSAGPSGTLQWQPRNVRKSQSGRALAAGLVAAVSAGVGLVLILQRTPSAPVADATPVAARHLEKAQPPQSAIAPVSGAGSTSAGGAGDGASSVSGGGAAASATPAREPVASGAPQPCHEPEATGEPMDAGMMRVRVVSACRANQDVHIAYGGADLVRRLDSGGRLDLTLDCFAGASMPVELRFEDGQTKSLPVETRDTEHVSKVALVWKAPVNLDLHAYEYAAAFGEKGHVWSRSSSSPEAARQEHAADNRGRGWLSTLSDGKTAGDKLEVYTFLHGDDQTEGIVAFGVDYETRGDKARDAACGNGKLAEVDFRLTLLSRSGRMVRETGIFSAAECGRTIDNDTRYQRLLAPVLKAAR